MRKWVILPLLLFSFISETTTAHYDGILLKDSELIDRIHIDSSSLLEMIVLPIELNDETEVKEIIYRMDRLPNTILERANHENIKIILFNGKLTDNKSAAHLKGKSPRGYEDHILWDDLPGIGGSELVLVKIGFSDQGKEHGSINLEYHEFAHSLLNLVYNDEDYTNIFHDIWLKEAEKLFPNIPYFLLYEEEYFAETFAYFYYSPETQSKLKRLAPETYYFFKEL